MKKDKYFSVENREAKISEWKKILSEFYSSKRKFSFDIQKAALLIVDMQEFFLNPKSHAYLPAVEVIIEPIKKLQNKFNENNRLVIFTKYGLLTESEEPSIMDKWWGDSLKINDPLAKLDARFDTQGAIILEKNTYDCFRDTNLYNLLEENNCKQIIIAGVATHLCCETTARSAFCYDFEVFLPIDCLATYTEELHLNTLKAASHGFGIPVTSNELLERKNDG
ncbi:MAG: cysteine hydrolase [Candidatus Heimdallarchaeota archaeon]|nr:cysteine hydrolase [Candidatus Heimdallarchaeota archaeon]